MQSHAFFMHSVCVCVCVCVCACVCVCQLLNLDVSKNESGCGSVCEKLEAGQHLKSKFVKWGWRFSSNIFRQRMVNFSIGDLLLSGPVFKQTWLLVLGIF